MRRQAATLKRSRRPKRCSKSRPSAVPLQFADGCGDAGGFIIGRIEAANLGQGGAFAPTGFKVELSELGRRDNSQAAAIGGVEQV